MRPSLILTLILFLPVAGLSPGPKHVTGLEKNRSASSPFDGAKIFQYHCAACHGADGRGQGPAAAALKNVVPDLTLILKENGGKFPAKRIRDLIAGTAPLAASHGSRQMPIWGPIFHEIDADQDWGEVRLDAITRYLESIQQK